MSNHVRFAASAEPLSQQINYHERAEHLREVTGAQTVILSSDDGLLVGADREAGRDDAESTAALGATQFGSALTLATLFPAGGVPSVRQVTLELGDERFVLLAQVGAGVRVILFTHPGPDLGKVAYEITKFADWFAPKVADRAEA